MKVIKKMKNIIIENNTMKKENSSLYIVFGCATMIFGLVALPLNWAIFGNEFGLNIFYNVYKETWNATLNLSGNAFVMTMYFIGLLYVAIGVYKRIHRDDV